MFSVCVSVFTSTAMVCVCCVCAVFVSLQICTEAQVSRYVAIHSLPMCEAAYMCVNGVVRVFHVLLLYALKS